MRISNIQRHLEKFENFLEHHYDPSIVNHHQFQTEKFKVYSATKILKNLELLATTLDKRGLHLEKGDREKIHDVLHQIQEITKGKIHRKRQFHTKHIDEFLHERLKQVISLNARLGIA